MRLHRVVWLSLLWVRRTYILLYLYLYNTYIYMRVHRAAYLSLLWLSRTYIFLYLYLYNTYIYMRLHRAVWLPPRRLKKGSRLVWREGRSASICAGGRRRDVRHSHDQSPAGQGYALRGYRCIRNFLSPGNINHQGQIHLRYYSGYKFE